jgi:thiol-disulfide isomerase/thioredoxin
MKKKSFSTYFQALVCILFALQCNAAYSAAVPEQAPAQITIPAPESPQAQKYLGLTETGPFALSKVNAKIVIIEFFNALCPKCYANAPIVNRLYKVIQDDAGLRDVKVIGIAVDSDKFQVDAFRKNFKVPFPLFIDENFAISVAMGGVDTPTTLVLATSNGKVLASHIGVIKDFEDLLKELRTIHKKL